MKEIDVETWYRKDVFRYFMEFDDPYFNITANVDVTSTLSLCKSQSLPVSLAILHLALKGANRIPEFRTRLVGEKIVEYEVVNGSQIVLHDDDTFSFCMYEAADAVKEFCAAGVEATNRVKETRLLDENPGRIDQIFFSVIPWVSFTSFKNAQRRDHTQTVPRIVFGKFFEAGDRRMMPVSVEVHHSMMDGVHVGRFFDHFQKLLNEPV